MSSSLPTLSYLLLDPSKPFIHRDLSWIQFNERVLAESRVKANPLLKRMKFLSISASNLDEFFMIRFASLVRSLNSSKEDNKANIIRIHSTVLANIRRFNDKQIRSFKFLRKEAAEKNIFLHLRCPKNSESYNMGRALFVEQILPHIHLKENFHFSALSQLQNLQFLVTVNKEIYYEVPKILPVAFSKVSGDKVHVFFLDDLLLSHLDHMLPLKDKPGILRITRDSDFTVEFSETDTESVPDLIRKSLGKRESGRLVRLQHAGNFPKDFLEEAGAHLKLDQRQVIRAPSTLCLHGLFGLVNDLPESISQKKGFSDPALKPMVPLPFTEQEKKNLFPALGELDFLLHHPYDSFDAFLHWIEAAAEDPNVTMIEQTIYRTEGASGLVPILKKAASKKKVRVFLELRARFDEMNNLKVAEELTQAGAEVKFGFGNLKLHAKISLVTRKEAEKLVRYTHLSTGNYNAKTARTYTDIAILTANQEVGEDARHFFDSLLKNHAPSTFKKLVVAPTKLHAKIKSLIKKETEAAKEGKKARIIAKVNALVDDKIIDDLYAASQAGVSIDLIVRGACSLIPGVKGLSENIRVISIVDRYLEHSRIYYFESSQEIYLSSADWMPRNFFSRLEIAFPVLDKRLYEYIVTVLLPGYLRDNAKARRLTAKGLWEKPPIKDANVHRAQNYFEELASRSYADTPLFAHPYFQK